MNVLGERLKQLRNEKGLNQTQLSEALNEQFGLKTDRVMISKWETGFQTPMINTISCIAKFFKVSIDYLNGNQSSTDFDDRYPTPNITKSYTTFPVIGEVAAGYDYPALEDWEGDTVEIPSEYLKGRRPEDFFVLRVKGDSMYPDFQDGDKVLVLKQSTMNYSGQVGVVIYNDDMGTLKRVEYKMGEDWMRLIPINPSYPPIKILDEDLEHCRVLGIPKLLIREIME